MTVANTRVTQVLLKRGNTTRSNQFTGALSELTHNTDDNSLRIHDGHTLGGWTLPTQAWVTQTLANAAIGNVDLTGYATVGYVNGAIANIEIPSVPSAVSSFTNDAGYITSSDLPDLSNYATQTYVTDAIANIEIPSVPSAVSSFTNDAGYITSSALPDLTGYATETYVTDAIANISIPTTYSNANVASYLPVYGGSIEATDITNSGKTWTYGTNGQITTPQGGVIGDTYSDGRGTSIGAGPGENDYAGINNYTGDQWVEADNSAVYIGTNYLAGGGNTWTFNKNGTIVFPNNTVDAGNNSIDIKSNQYAELFYEGQDTVWQADTTRNQQSYIWTAWDGSYIQNYRGADGNGGPTWNQQWTFGNDGNLRLPTNMDFGSSPAVATSGIVFADSTYQNTAFTSQLLETYVTDQINNISIPSPYGDANVTAYLAATSIDSLSDVDTTSTAPEVGQVLKWNGTNWVPGVDATTGGGGTDADTLDGQHGSYYLNYNNFSNVPDLSVYSTVSNAASQQTQINSLLAGIYTDSNVATYLTAQGIAPQVQVDWSQSNTGTVDYIKNKPDLSVYATQTDVSTAINNLINAAPGTLDTLGEIAANLAAEAGAIGSILSSIASTNANVSAVSANVLQSDWAQANTGNITYIKNKPDLSVYATVSSLTGGAITVTTSNVSYYPNVVATSSSTTHYVELASSASGNLQTYTSTNLTYQPSSGNLQLAGNLIVDSGMLRTSAPTATIFNGTPSTVNAFGNATTITMGKSNGTATFAGNVAVQNVLQIGSSQEAVNNIGSVTGNVNINFVNTAIAYVTPTGNINANIQNLNIVPNSVTSVSLWLSQGATPYYLTNCYINGALQTINWQAGVVPTPNASKKDIYAISILNVAGSYTVLGQLISFG